MKSLSELRVGERGVIVRLEGTGEVRRRLLSMGFVAGTEVEPVRVAPMGDPVAYELKSYRLSLRREEAAYVFVEPIRETPLEQAEPGVPMRVSHVHGGWGARRRLGALGIRRGAEVVRLRDDGAGPLRVAVVGRERRLGRGIAARVLVQREEHDGGHKAVD